MTITASLELTDPTHHPVDRPNALERFGLSLINDPRDLPFLKLMASYSLVMFPFALYLFLPGRFTWWLAVLYQAVNFLVFVDRCILMLHNVSHRALFKPKLRWMNSYVANVMGPFFGESPETYFGHHLGMHHPENNLKDDLSTTMPYQRDSFLGFLHYWATFMVTTIVALPRYLWTKNRKKLALRTVGGELLFLAACGAGLWFNWRATFVVFVIPYLVVRFLMMWGNWGQHAFVDPARPANAYVNSITCINSRYNRRCFNDGYHIGHHVKANRHWTEMPEDFQRNLETYAREGAIVFEGLDFFMVSLFLFLKRYDWLADRYVQLGSEKKSREEIIALLKARLRPIAT